MDIDSGDFHVVAIMESGGKVYEWGTWDFDTPSKPEVRPDLTRCICCPEGWNTLLIVRVTTDH